MTISASGAVNFSDIKAEMGGSGAVSLSEYYGISAGLPASGEISMDDFRGEQFDVIDLATSTGSYSPRASRATYVHIFAVGAGGSGGSSEYDTSINITTGVAASGGGGGGGVSYHKLAISDFTGSYTLTIGAGGAGVYSAGDHWIAGNAGGATSVVGNLTSLTANGGSAGNADEDSNLGTDTSTALAAAGGTASGGNQDNWTGGASGLAKRTGDTSGSASGGGAPAFSSSNYDGTDSYLGATAGGLVSTKNDLPDVIQTYLSNRGQSLTLTDFDASSGVYQLSSGGSESPTFGAGSGGACHGSGRQSGDGGDGVVIIIYEVT